MEDMTWSFSKINRSLATDGQVLMYFSEMFQEESIEVMKDYVAKNGSSFSFISMQSKQAERDLRKNDLPFEMNTICFSDEGKIYQRSEAVFEILKGMNYPYRLLRVFRIFPRFITDGVYNYIAKNRYKWFGKEDSCRIPLPSETKYFLCD